MNANVGQLLRYGGTSALCALTNVAILVIADAGGLHYVAGTALSFAACVLLGYALHCTVTFAEAMSLTGLGRYTAAMLLNFPLSILALYLLHDLARLDMALAAPIATLSLIAYNFLSSRWAIRRKAA